MKDGLDYKSSNIALVVILNLNWYILDCQVSPDHKDTVPQENVIR